MTEALRQCLPAALADACWCGRIRGATLTVTVRNSQQGALLRCHQREVVKHLNSLYAARLPEALQKLQVHVAAQHDRAAPLTPD